MVKTVFVSVKFEVNWFDIDFGNNWPDNESLKNSSVDTVIANYLTKDGTNQAPEILVKLMEELDD